MRPYEVTALVGDTLKVYTFQARSYLIEDGYLKLLGQLREQVIASFAPGAWQSVMEAQPVKAAPNEI